MPTSIKLLIDHPDREICPPCRTQLEKPGFFLIDNQNIRSFRCLKCTLLILSLALEPIRSTTISREE